MSLSYQQEKFLSEPIILPSQREILKPRPGVFERIKKASSKWMAETTNDFLWEPSSDNKAGGGPPPKKESHPVGQLSNVNEQLNDLHQAVQTMNSIVEREVVSREELEVAIGNLNVAVKSLSVDMEGFHRRYGSMTPSSLVAHIGTSLQNAPIVTGKLQRGSRFIAGVSTAVTILCTIVMLIGLVGDFDTLGVWAFVTSCFSGTTAVFSWVSVAGLGLLLKRAKET